MRQAPSEQVAATTWFSVRLEASVPMATKRHDRRNRAR
jgi:hypothetical protein